MIEILEYDGGITMILREAKELFDYHFSAIYWPAHMMMDIEPLSHRFVTLTTQYIQVATLLSNSNRKVRPAAYAPGFKKSSQATKIPVSPHVPCAPPPILTAKVLQSATPNNIVSTDKLCPVS